MNFVAHLLIAMANQPVEATSDFAFGSVLPDLASMGRLRFDRDGLSEGTVEGVQFHQRTDEVFHSHEWFTSLQVAGVKHLRAENVPRGAARACSHVGVELLLDGVLLESSELAVATDTLFDSLDSQNPPGPLHDAWRDLLVRASNYGPPRWYGEPESIAEFLQRVTSARPRLSFGDEHVAPVAAWLLETRAAVQDSAWELVADIQQKLRH